MAKINRQHKEIIRTNTDGILNQFLFMFIFY